ncbi:MAG: protein-glutamine glutaminase family protein [Proteobacteria bacterium]|nr:protein-glutamine glutaminase family protein [Pseudomonadota bacterium]
MEAASSLFNKMAAQDDIAFKFPVDGCYARAHLMVQRMQKLGASPSKVWTFASSKNDPLWVNTPNHPSGKVIWNYHVAPTIPVQQEDGTVKDMVVDPSLFDHPVTVEEWRETQHDNPKVVKTKIGEPPIPENGGSGYWPSEDPPKGTDADARKTMENFKSKEGGY